MIPKAITSALCAVAAAAALSMSGVTVAGASEHHAGGKAGAAIKFKHGHPTLKGIKITMINGAGSNHVGDTNNYDQAVFLRKWGAKVTYSNVHASGGQLAVAAGKATFTNNLLSGEMDAGLTTFGPVEIHTTLYLYTKKTIKSLKQLKGAETAISYSVGPTALFLRAIEKKTGLSRSAIPTLVTGGATASMDALIAGKVTAAFFAAATLPTSATKLVRRLVGAQTMIPEYSSIFLAAKPTWLRAHKKTAVVIDLAWLASAKLFDTNEKLWVKNAAAYTTHADSISKYESAYKYLKALNAWRVTKKDYTAGTVEYNIKLAKSLGTITGLGNRTASEEITASVWNTAWRLWKKYGTRL